MTGKLSLDPDGRDFILSLIDEQGNKNEMRLSEDNVITLGQSAERVRDYILAKHTKEGQAHPPVVVLPVVAIELNADVHYTHLHITMVQENGGRSPCFALPSDVAKSLSAALPAWVSEMEKNKIKH